MGPDVGDLDARRRDGGRHGRRRSGAMGGHRGADGARGRRHERPRVGAAAELARRASSARPSCSASRPAPALTIAMTQLPKLFGVAGGGEHFFERIALSPASFPTPTSSSSRFGLAALALLLLGEKLLPGRPVALFVVALSIVALSVTSLGEPASRSSASCRRACPTSARRRCGCATSTASSRSRSRAFCSPTSKAFPRRAPSPQKNGYAIDPRQELLGLGVRQSGRRVRPGLPDRRRLSQSSVNDKAGAKTPLALVFASLTIALCLLFLTGLLRNLPNVVLAAIVLVAVKGLINIAELAAPVAREPVRVQRLDGRVRRRAGARDPQGRDAGRGGVAADAPPARGAPARRLPRPHSRFPRPFGPRAQPGQRAGSGRARLPRRGGVALFQRRARAGRGLVEGPPERGAVGWWWATSPRPRTSTSPARGCSRSCTQRSRRPASLSVSPRRAPLCATCLRAEELEERVGYFGRRITAVDVVDEFEGFAQPAGSSAGKVMS